MLYNIPFEKVSKTKIIQHNFFGNATGLYYLNSTLPKINNQYVKI